MKILVLCDNLKAGGIEKSFVNFMNIFKNGDEKNQISYMLMEKKGVFLDEIPEGIDLIEYNGDDIFETSWKNRKNAKHPIRLFCAKVISKLGLKKLGYNILFKKVKQKFDFVLIFRAKQELLEYAKYNIKAKKRVVIHHGFADSLFLGSGNKEDDEKLVRMCFENVDEIWTVSESCMKTFIERYGMQERFNYLYNTFNEKNVLIKKDEFKADYDNKYINIVSIIRFSEEKAPERMIEQFVKLSEEGFKFYLHLVGGGELLDKCKRMVEEHGLEKNIIFYGVQSNPYPYLKSADLFLLPSVYEAAPMVYAEAMVLGVPVLTTDLISSKELVGEKGFICENSGEGIYNGVKEILSNTDVLTEKKERLKDYSYNNEAIKDKFLRLVNNDENTY